CKLPRIKVAYGAVNDSRVGCLSTFVINTALQERLNRSQQNQIIRFKQSRDEAAHISRRNTVQIVRYVIADFVAYAAASMNLRTRCKVAFQFAFCGRLPTIRTRFELRHQPPDVLVSATIRIIVLMSAVHVWQDQSVGCGLALSIRIVVHYYSKNARW